MPAAILRDRQTLVTLILMPLLVYPILSLVFQRSLLSAWSFHRNQLIIGVTSNQMVDVIKRNLSIGDAYLRSERGQASPAPVPRPDETQQMKASLENLLPGEFTITDIQFLEQKISQIKCSRKRLTSAFFLRVRVIRDGSS